MENQQIAKFQSLTQAQYMLRKGDDNARLIILNHGFLSTNTRMWDRFEKLIPSHFNVLAPQGPFPIPQKRDDKWSVSYSWFFYDNVEDYFLVHYDICKDYIKNLCGYLGFENHSKTVIGFSQGGYAAPHMAESLKNVNHVIGIGCRFKIKNPKWPESLIIEAVHGEDDDIVQWEGAQQSFSQLPEKHRGRLQSFAGVKHTPSPEMIETVVSWVKEKT